jgi:signal peptidase I
MTRTGRRWKRRALFDARYVRMESRRAYRLAFLLFWSVLLYFATERYILGLGVVTDRSMVPTMAEGSHFLINKYIYRLTQPQRGDVIVFARQSYQPEQPEAQRYVKRVIALGGETLLIKAGKVFINGRELSEPYVLGTTYPRLGPLRVPEGACFVMGDNRPRSEDSRHFGPVALKELEGRITPHKLFAFF